MAIPGKVIKIEGDNAIIDFCGTKRTANISLISVEEGDYVIVNAGFAMEKLNKEQAIKSIQEWENAGTQNGRNRGRNTQ